MEQQKVQQAMRTHFNNLAFAQKDSIQAMQANNNTAGLDALEKELIAKTEAEFMLNPDKGRFTAEQKAVYTTVGGTPFLDGEYTVFGEVVEGLEIVDQIQRCQTGTADRPKSDITMTMRMVAE